MFSSPYMIVDAFATEPFTGNPAAVVLDACGLDDATMQKIAAEFNLSETTFVLPPTAAAREAEGATVRFRWFTPRAEVAMCGHATVAGIHTLVESKKIRQPSDESVALRIETLTCVLSACVEEIPGSRDRRMIWLDLPPPKFKATKLDLPELAPLLATSISQFDASIEPVRTRDEDFIVFVDGFLTLNDIRPDFARLGEFLQMQRLRGLCIATLKTLTPSVHVQCRFFAPHYGINEDPVTGSAYGPLAAYLASLGHLPSDGSMAAATCVQGVPGGRTGLLQALVEKSDRGYSVRIGGQAVTTMQGVLEF